MRRTISCTLASLVGALALMITPASSLAFEVAGGGEACPGTCPARHYLQVEVRLATPGTEGEGYSISVPRLPQRAVVDNYLVRQDFKELAAISGITCRITKLILANPFPGTDYTTVTGFVPELEQFNGIRYELNVILQRYNLGFAPELTDFSDINTLVYNYTVKVRHGHRSINVIHHEEEGLAETHQFSEPGCIFTLV